MQGNSTIIAYREMAR